jgi:hypothetical protein
MLLRTCFVAAAALLAGCASGGGAANGGPSTVPVYTGASAVPCQYEMMRRVEGETTVPFVSSREVFERERARVLGREGARLGANAVVVADATAIGGTQVAIPANQIPSTRVIRFEGEAVRYLDPTCGSAG